jgi:hypothetical protein
VQPFSEATLAGVAQTAGALTAAIMMQVIPVFVSNDYDPDELDCFRNLALSQIHFLTSSNIVQAIFGMIYNSRFKQIRKVFAPPHVSALQPLIRSVHLGALQWWDGQSHLARGNHSPNPYGDDLCFSAVWCRREPVDNHMFEKDSSAIFLQYTLHNLISYVHI